MVAQSAQANGRLTLAGRLGEETAHGCLFGPGLLDAAEAEIHVVVQEHGWSLPAGAGREEQIAFFQGNCNRQFPVNHLPRSRGRTRGGQ